MNNEILQEHQTYLSPTIPMRKKVGYAFGGATDTLAYDFAAAFLLFFMTDCAGVNPAWAGTIITIGVLWDMVTDPIVGNLSDKTKTRFGRKRTWLIIAIVPMFVSYLLLFTRFDMSESGKNIYFLGMTLLFWLSYTCFNIPYYSIGASMTMNNTERTKIRMLGMVIQYVGVFFSTVAPTLFVSFFKSQGADTYQAWHYTAWIEAVLCVITMIIVVISTKGIEIDFEPVAETKKEKNTFFKDCIQILQIKPYLIMLFSSLSYRIGYCLFLTTMVYFFLYVVALSELQMTVCTSIISFGGIIVISLLMKVVERVDKVKIYCIFVTISAIGMIIFNFMNINSLALGCLVSTVYVIGSSAYWSLNFPLMYDSIEVDEFQHGVRREGTMLSFYLLCQKGGYAIAASAIGYILANVGYNDSLGANNSQKVLDAIQSIFCLGSGIFFLISALIIILLYPLKKTVYDKLYTQLELKRAGKPFNINGFENILNKRFVKSITESNKNSR